MSGWVRALIWLLACFIGAVWQPVQAQSVVRYYVTDALGSVVVVTDESGNVMERREYEPYGAQLTPAVQDGPGYTGHVQDAATGLVYMQQRYYDPQIGRFLSVDPVTAYSNPVGAFNRYWYANNNPYLFTDPDGRQVVVPWGQIGEVAAKRGVQAGIASQLDSPLPGPGDLAGAIILIGAVGEIGYTIWQANQSEGDAPPLPDGLVGENPRATGKSGGAAVGTSLPGDKFPGVVEDLTGGTLGTPDSKGRSVAPNGVSVRTGGTSGPRIDIPENGTKPPEIIHFPEDTPIPETLKPQP